MRRALPGREQRAALTTTGSGGVCYELVVLSLILLSLVLLLLVVVVEAPTCTGLSPPRSPRV